MESNVIITCAGLAVVANDTGRVLMLQRALDDTGKDPHGGKWEFPGGKLDSGEDPLEAAKREWSEETGHAIPKGKLDGEWVNDIYKLFIYRVEKESDLDINMDHEDRHVLNPDDPDGDQIETVAWWSIDDLISNPALREETRSTDWSLLKKEGETKVRQPLSTLGFSSSSSFSANQIFSLVNLTLMDGEDGHYHWDPETQFYNHCHDEDGRFCEAEGGIVSGNAPLRDSDSPPVVKATGNEKRGPYGSSLVDPHEGTKEYNGLRGYHPETGKPVAGTDAWLDAHGIPREMFNKRPYVRFEPDKNDPALHEAFERGTKGAAQWDRLAGQEGQEGGYIMYKHPVPDSPYGPIKPQVRPHEGAVTNFGKRKQKELRLEAAKQRYKDLKTKIKPEQLIKEQEARVKKAEVNLERTKKATPEIIRAETKKNLADATDNYAKAKATKDPDTIAVARKELNAAKRDVTTSEYKANKFKPESAVYHAQKELDSAKQRLGEIKEDPKGFLAAEIIRQGGIDGKGGRIKRAENAFKDQKAKYLFTSGEKGETARIDMNPDKQNVHNLMNTKGRIYFAMEGSIKNDAILAAIKREDPTAAVVNVPSVTLWHNKSAGEGEIQWFARTHGKDRQVVLIPDADGVNNVNVMRQANAMASALKNHGASQVLVAAPPVKYGTKSIMDPIKMGSKDSNGRDVFDERKGIDDHLGAGRGTLGQLAYQTDAKIPKFSLFEKTREGGNAEDKKLNRNALKNHEAMLGAISGLAGKNGAAQVSMNLLMQTSGITSKGSAVAARDKLHDLGIIDVRYVFDKDVLANSRKRVPVMPQKEIDSWVSKRIIKPLPEDLYAKDDYEASPIIVIKDPKYIVKAENSSTGVLSDLPDWKPPKSYDGWRSTVTGKKDTTGIAARMASEEAKTKAKGPVTPKTIPTTKTVAKTTAQRAAAKKAPAGRRLVRTAEGAKRYGVRIGQPIPLSANAITSTVLLSAVMTQEELNEFYNQCHGEGGLFCEGTDGPGRARDNVDKGKGRGIVKGKFLGIGGANVRTVAEVSFGSVEVDGIKAKAVYEAETGNGDTIRVYDKTGKVGGYKHDLLNAQVRMHNLYPMYPPRNIVVVDPDAPNSPVGDGSFATVYGDSPNTYVNSEWLGHDTRSFGDGFQMPSAKQGNTKDMSYLLTHEYGHQVDFARHSDNGSNYQKHPLNYNSYFTDNLSKYGRSDSQGVEAYAEAFAEWHHSGGTTLNPAAVTMARYENWVGADSLISSGELVHLTHQALVQFAKKRVKVTEHPEDTEEDIYADIPTPSGIAVNDTFNEDGPAVSGIYELIEPSEEEIEQATKVADEVLYGFKGIGGRD